MAVSHDVGAEGNDLMSMLYADVSTSTIVQYSGAREGHIFATQVSAKKAASTFGRQGTEAIHSEIRGLLDKQVFSGVLKSSLSETQRKKIIRMSCFVRDKRNSDGSLQKIKARLVAGGHMQDKTVYTMDQTSSPTVATSSVFSIISTGLSEGRKFLKFDISMAYLNAKMPDEVYMTLDPDMSDILCEEAEQLDRGGDFRKDNSGRVTVKLEKALYGCVQSARLWYNHFSTFLKRIGFAPNPYDQCVFNRVHNGKQLTLAMHVDDGLATCEDLEQLQWLDNEIRKEFNNEVESTINENINMHHNISISNI